MQAPHRRLCLGVLIVKKEAFSHSKMRRLQRTLGRSLSVCVGVLECLWNLAARETPRGNIGKLTTEDIFDFIGFEGVEPEELIDALVKCGWLDRDPVHGLLIHDWPEHSDNTLHASIARRREFFLDGSAPRLTGLNSTERSAAAAFYSSHTPPTTQSPGSDSEDTPRSNHGATTETTRSHFGSRAPEAMPCHAMPKPGLEHQQAYMAAPISEDGSDDAFEDPPSDLEIFGPDAVRERKEDLTPRQSQAVRILTQSIFKARDYPTHAEGQMWRELFADGLTPAVARDVIADVMERRGGKRVSSMLYFRQALHEAAAEAQIPTTALAPVSFSGGRTSRHSPHVSMSQEAAALLADLQRQRQGALA